MAEYISREAALQFVFDACAECLESALEFDGINPDCHYCMLEGVKLKLRDYPTADVQPAVRAAWQSWEQDKPPCKWYSCNYCGFHSLEKHHYCPNCGCKMDLEDNK